MTKLEDAFFGIMMPNPNKDGMLEPANLFGSMRVLHSIAIWKTDPRVHTSLWGSKKEPQDILSWCFGDTRGRCEYEWVVSPWVGPDKDNGKKTDVYTMYVEPNRELLTRMVDDISTHSCQKWLREYRKKYGRGI